MTLGVDQVPCNKLTVIDDQVLHAKIFFSVAFLLQRWLEQLCHQIGVEQSWPFFHAPGWKFACVHPWMFSKPVSPLLCGSVLQDRNQINLVWHNPDLFSKATCGRELHLQELLSIWYAVLVTLETTRHPHGARTDDSRSAQMMCWYPQLSSTHVIKAVFVRFNLC